MKLLERIEIHPRVCNGKPVIKRGKYTEIGFKGLIEAGDEKTE